MTVLDLAKRWAEPPRILVAVDDASSVRAMCETLSNFGCDVHIVSTQEAIGVLASKFDIIFLDLSLPDGSSVNVVEAAREEQPSTPVVVLVGPDRRCFEEAMRCGTVTMLRKPFDLTPQHLKNALAMFKVRVGYQAQALATATAGHPCC